MLQPNAEKLVALEKITKIVVMTASGRTFIPARPKVTPIRLLFF
jgi:hypothetical protein